LIAQQEQELQLVPAHVPQQVLVQELVQEQALESVSQLAQVLESEPAQVSQPVLVQVQVQHPLHQPPRSRCQLQRSRLLQHEFLSIHQQLAKALPYQLCL
jgi:phosphoribosylaminoimidazole carboxylase (NCAIR synthetase)